VVVFLSTQMMDRTNSDSYRVEEEVSTPQLPSISLTTESTSNISTIIYPDNSPLVQKMNPEMESSVKDNGTTLYQVRAENNVPIACSDSVSIKLQALSNSNGQNLGKEVPASVRKHSIFRKKVPRGSYRKAKYDRFLRHGDLGKDGHILGENKDVPGDAESLYM